MLASEYGWSMDYILNALYFEEIQSLLPHIRKRQLSEYKLQLSMIENPHRENPGALWDVFNVEDGTYIKKQELDKDSFAKFKNAIAKSGGLVVK